MTLQKELSYIVPTAAAVKEKAQAHWNRIAKPLHSLGLLEDAIIKIAAVLDTEKIPPLKKKAVIVMCADHGVIAEGVSQTGAEVTATVTENMHKGVTSVCRMASIAGVDVIPVDIGVYRPVQGSRILQCNIRRGTANMTKGPAMQYKEALSAIQVGIDLVADCKEKGYTLLGTGEMGIGNTTASSALASVLLNVAPETVTGCGAGLSQAGLLRKQNAIAAAIHKNKPDPEDPLDMLHKIGGLDIAGLTGVFLGGAIHRIPVVIDGFISAVAALLSVRLSPYTVDYMLASHMSKEPACKLLLDTLGLSPFIYANLCLGEGTGAVAAMPLLDMAVSVYRDMATFEDIAVDAYTPFH